jgi:hypothetical protein
MNIVLDINKFSLGNTFFLETKRNIVIQDGTFTKIIYSNQYMTMNGIFFYFPIEIQSIDKLANKNIMKFYPSSMNNSNLVQDLSKLEYKIIEYYKQLNNCSKKTSCLFSKQLYSGNLKIYKEYNDNYSHKNCEKETGNINYIIKFSGIWETLEEVGLTYKVIECY